MDRALVLGCGKNQAVSIGDHLGCTLIRPNRAAAVCTVPIILRIALFRTRGVGFCMLLHVMTRCGQIDVLFFELGLALRIGKILAAFGALVVVLITCFRTGSRLFGILFEVVRLTAASGKSHRRGGEQHTARDEP